MSGDHATVLSAEGATSAAVFGEPPDLHEWLLQEARRRVPALGSKKESLLVFVADEQMRYVAVSQSVCDLLGYEREELLGLRVTDVAVEQAAADEYSEMVESGARVGVAKIRARDGQLFDLSYSAAELVSEDGRLFASVGHILDGERRASADSSPGRMRVLVADDHEPTRLLVRTLLDFVESVEVVGEAKDGAEAVSMTSTLSPDVVLLDIHMPRMDGLTAAEVLRGLHPRTQVVLHTAQPDDEIRAHADKLGVPLLDKMRFDDVLDVLDARLPKPALSGLPDPRVEAIVLTALTASRSDTPVLVMQPDGSVPFYTVSAAELLGLPLPMRPMTVPEIQRSFEVLSSDGTPLAAAQRPLARALALRRHLEDLVIIKRGDTETMTRLAVLPFYADDGQLLGISATFEPV